MLQPGDVFCSKDCARVYWIVNTPMPYTKVVLRVEDRMRQLVGFGDRRLRTKLGLKDRRKP